MIITCTSIPDLHLVFIGKVFLGENLLPAVVAVAAALLKRRGSLRKIKVPRALFLLVVQAKEAVLVADTNLHLLRLRISLI